MEEQVPQGRGKELPVGKGGRQQDPWGCVGVRSRWTPGCCRTRKVEALKSDEGCQRDPGVNLEVLPGPTLGSFWQKNICMCIQI